MSVDGVDIRVIQISAIGNSGFFVTKGGSHG